MSSRPYQARGMTVHFAVPISYALHCGAACSTCIAGRSHGGVSDRAVS
jgi:hypothetical protein